MGTSYDYEPQIASYGQWAHAFVFHAPRTNCAMGTGGRLDSLKLWTNRHEGSGNDVGMIRTRRATRVSAGRISHVCDRLDRG